MANNRIITLQEDAEIAKEESSYQLETRKVKEYPPYTNVINWEFRNIFTVMWHILGMIVKEVVWLIQALRSDSAADGQALGETRKQLKEETLLRLVSFRLWTTLSFHWYNKLYFTYVHITRVKRRVKCGSEVKAGVSVQDVERELEVQIGMKQEMELSMKMLEKDICEKQDALVELRQQLEDLRAINQQLSHKSQVRHHCCICAGTL